MKEIKEEDFLMDVVCYAKKEISLKELILKYKTDYRTMHNRITSLAETNPDVFKLIVEAHPYNEKKRNDLNFRNIMIEIMKSGITVREASQKYKVSVRTLQRRVEEISKQDPEFAKLYRKCTNNSKTGKKNSEAIKEQIAKYEYGNTIIGGINEDRESKLIKLKNDFEKLLESGMTKNDAALKLGLLSSNDVYKKLKELERIQKEKQILEEGKRSFKDSIKVDTENNKEKEEYVEKNKTKLINLSQNNQEER